MRSKILFILAILMGLITTILFFNYMKQFDAATVASENMIEVVAAKQSISRNQVIGPAMVEIVRMPQLGVHPEAIRSVAEVDGKYAEANIAAGEVLLGGRLKLQKDETALVARKVQEGYRAVSVGVNVVQSVSNLIEPEDYIDLILTETDKVTGQITSTLLQEKVRVLAVGRRLVESGPEAPYVEYSSVTVEVKPAEAVTIVNADEKGNISMALHSRIVEVTAEANAKAN
jgi:pilus assembly protein CpaB